MNNDRISDAESRKTEEPPTWAPQAAVHFVPVEGSQIRYLSVGSGPTLVLLHSLRTQLDMFQKIIPALATHFQVYALDFPGHGHSDAPDASYDAKFFLASVAGFLERMKVEDAIVVGESIGATIGLLLTADDNPRVRGVVAINPYDYDRGRGLRRSSLLANAVLGLTALPVLGEMIMLTAPYAIVRRILYGGVQRRESFPPGLLRDLHLAGKRPGHPRAFARLVRGWPSWERARDEYKTIHVPVLLVYGDHDWSDTQERHADEKAIPGARVSVVENAGHFLSLDAPGEFVRLVENEVA